MYNMLLSICSGQCSGKVSCRTSSVTVDEIFKLTEIYGFIVYATDKVRTTWKKIYAYISLEFLCNTMYYLSLFKYDKHKYLKFVTNEI